MTDPALISPAYALAHVCPEFVTSLTDAERAVAAYQLSAWLRPEQIVPRGHWRSFGMKGGRGFGKSFGIAVEINRRVACGECRSPALMAPNEDRVGEVQVKFLVESSPPWFKAEAYGEGVRWPNGVVAEARTPGAPGRSRSSNYDCTWLCEIVDWPETKRLDAYQNIATATRVGAAQILWDTTSKGNNEVIQFLIAQHTEDPANHILVEGSSFDNPLLSRNYLRDLVKQYVKGSRRYNEEILGMTYAETAGALWQQAWLDKYRLDFAPSDLDIVIVSLDPSLSDKPDADEAGASVVGRARDGKCIVLDDLSGRQKPEKWATAAVARCMRDASGVLYERNHAGDMPRDLIKVIAKEKGLSVEVLTDDKRPFPQRKPGTIYLRSITSRNDKGTRAEGPAAMYSRGEACHVGVFDALELEMTTWEPGGKSPNRLDAAAQGIAELAGLRDQRVTRGSPRDVETVAALQRDLQRSLRGSGRRMGL